MKGIDKEEYQAWCAFPMTEMFKQALENASLEALETKNNLDPMAFDGATYHIKSLVAHVSSEVLKDCSEMLDGSEESFDSFETGQ